MCEHCNSNHLSLLPDFSFLKPPFHRMETTERPLSDKKLCQISQQFLRPAPPPPPPPPPQKKVVSVEMLWGSLRDHWGTKNSNFNKFHGDQRRPLSDSWAFVERPTATMHPCRDYWVLIVRSLRDQLRSMRDQLWSLRDDLRSLRDQLGLTEITERPARTNGDHWMTERVHQKCCVCWKIRERLLKDWWDRRALIERSLSIQRKSASLKDHRETVLNQFKIWWRPWGP